MSANGPTAVHTPPTALWSAHSPSLTHVGDTPRWQQGLGIQRAGAWGCPFLLQGALRGQQTLKTGRVGEVLRGLQMEAGRG